jgi:hypothetical protein
MGDSGKTIGDSIAVAIMIYTGLDIFLDHGPATTTGLYWCYTTPTPFGNKTTRFMND